MFRGDVAHTGFYETAGLDGYGGMLWRADLEGPVRSTAAVVGDTVYVGSAAGLVFALDRDTGEERWRRPTDAAVNGSPAAADGTVWVTDQASTLYALDAASGELRWRVDTGTTLPFPWGHESGDIYASSPALAGDRVLFGAGDGKLYAVDRASGEVDWTLQTEGRIRSTPAVAAGRAYVGSADGRLYAADLQSGALLWRHDTEGVELYSGDFGYDRRTIQSSPAVSDGRVYIGARDGSMYALDAATGERLWRMDHGGSWVNSSPAVAHGLVFAGTSDGHFVQGVDAATGEERWRTETDTSVWTSPAVVGDGVIFTEGDGRVRELDAATGETRWSTYLPGAIRASPVIDDGVLFVGTVSGGMYALRGAGGRSFHRAVFWDEDLTVAAWYRGHEELRRWLEGRGYEVLDARALTDWIDRRLEDGEPSAVVFALDHLPEAVGGGAGGVDAGDGDVDDDGAPGGMGGGQGSRLRRYLGAGGTVVWVGVPPRLWRRDPVTGDPGDLDRVTWEGPRRLLGVDHAPAIFDPKGAFTTSRGRSMGLPGWWLSTWNAAAQPGLEELARDEECNAAAWRRGYGGPSGTGFVRIWGARAPIPDPAPVLVAAELRGLGGRGATPDARSGVDSSRCVRPAPGSERGPSAAGMAATADS